MKAVKQQFSQSDVQVLGKVTLYDGFFRMEKCRFRHRLFAGGWSDTLEREIFEKGHAIALLPYDPIRQEFVLIEQFRFGAMASSDSPWLLEVVAGIIDPGEQADEVCHREAQEEAGLQLLSVRKALSYLSSPGRTSERIEVYVAQVDASQAAGLHGLPHEGEDIKVHRVAEADAFAWIQNGKIDNAASLIALQWFFINKQDLLNEWTAK